MSTSLAEQLRRLKTPQTTLLVDSKKRASILFNPKEAAEKDRETIFDIGYSGFEELIKLNPAFLQFESSLFDKNAREFQRAVENKDINRQLKEVIKKFLIHLSPYLLLQPSHKCLEWLIRRFNINLYEKSEFMMLILPYHETTIFVKCLQTMNVSDVNDLWHWLEPVKKNGVPLSKQALLNRVGSDNFLMSFICESIVYAVNELDTRSHTLQVYYAFFCTSVIGALDAVKINESHITNIYGAIRKGIKSTSIDFCAASLMIIGQLVNKVKLKREILESFVNMLLERVSHAKLQQDVIILLVLIYRNQSETIGDISQECLTKLLVNTKWLPPVLAKIYTENVNILPFYLPLLSACLKHVQLKSGSWKKCRKFCDALLSEIFFKPEHAESVIRCTLDSFILTEKVDDTIIEIESGNEDEDMEGTDKGITTWYTNTLKALERRYPTTFDAIVKEIVRSDNKSMSELKKRSLKKVLSFLFTIVCADDNVNLFEKLYHYNAQQRVEAIKYLVKNLSKMSFSDDSKSLLKGSIAERLSDDSPLVVKEALKFNNSALLRFMNKAELIKKYVSILEQTLKKPKVWEDTALEAVKHLGDLCSKNFPIEILVAILPLLLQPSELSVGFLRKIFISDLANHVELIKACKDATAGTGDNKEAMTSAILRVFESKKGLPQIGHILNFIKSTSDEDLSLNKAFYAMLLLFHSFNVEKPNPLHLPEILNVIERFEKQFKMGNSDSAKWPSSVAKGRYPVNIHIAFIKKIIDTQAKIVQDQFKGKFIEFSKPMTNLSLLRQIFEYFIAQMSRRQSKYALFEDGLKHFIAKLFDDPQKCIEYLSNYYTIDVLYPEPNNLAPSTISIEHQVFIINYVNSLIQTEDGILHGVQLQLQPFVRIMNALRSPNSEVREAAYDTFVILKSTDQPKFKTLISKLVRRQSEILMDDNQLPLILFKIFDKKPSTDLTNNLMEFMEYIATSNDNEFLVAHLLEALTHVNSEEILKSIVNIAMDILTAANEEMEKTAKKVLCLDHFKSTIIRNILSRYTQQTIKLIKKLSCPWQVLLKAAESYGVLLKGKSKETPVTHVIVDVFNDDLFNELSEANQRQFIAALVNSATYAENAGLYTNISKFFKQIQLNGRICVEILDEMAKTDQFERMEVDEVPATTRQRRSSQCASDGGASAELLKMKSWKRGVTWLEFLQNKKNINDPHRMIPSLFAVLQKCLQFEDQSNVEYVKQLSLACLYHLCVIIAPEGKVQSNLISEKNFKIEPVVQCIRGTQNPQTHHHALQLLSHSAKMLPEQVLHNMMDIFTFMGSSVVRHDDVYSFQIITNIISSIIPTLTRVNENKSEAERNELVIPVLKVFSDIILDVPEHRRLPLYNKLLDTLNADNYLWMFLTILIENYITHHQPEVEKTIRQPSTLAVELPQRIEIALALAKEFDARTIIVTATKMIGFLQKMPVNKPTNESEKIPAEISALFNINAWSKRQFRHFKYETLKVINTLTSSVDFVNKVAVLSDDEAASIKEHYQNAIINILTYIPIISKATEAENSHADYWKALLHNCFDILENVISLLSSNVLLVVVHGLLSHKLSSVRRRVIELLINKLQHNPEIFSKENAKDLVSLLEPLTKIIESIIDEKKLMQNASSIENTAIQQMALMAVKLLSKQLAEKHPKDFKYIVETLIDILRKSEKVPRILLATVLLCLCEICANLRVHSIAYLPSFMKIFLEILKGYTKPENVCNDGSVLIYFVTGLLKIVGTLALYMSPYLVEMIVRLSQIWWNIETEATKDPKRSFVIDRLNGIWEKLSTTLELRILIPSIDQSYKRLVNDEQSIAIGPLMLLLTQTFEQQAAGNISRFMPDITSFFITALQFRSDHADIELATLNKLEDKIVKSFGALTLKLSEGSFRPLYYRIYDWAIKQNNKDLDHTITYFRLSIEIANSLKSLFVLFANDFIDDIPELLNKSLASEFTKPSDVLVAKTSLLIEGVIETLYQVFLHDSRGFINGARFEAILQPLVDQIENQFVLDSSKLMNLVSLALAQLGQAVNDDIQWKQLNYQILMKTRNNESRIRLFALKVGVALAAKLGEDYMPLLPETVPFISELLEDENPEVEKQCQLSVQELEKILGEPLQKYF